MKIAVQPDNRGDKDSSSPIWSRLLRDAGHEVKRVNVFASDILEQLQGCHGLMWRFGQSPKEKQIARRLLPVVEREMGLAVYPDQATCWHYDDKITQAHLLEAHGIPRPDTWVWHEKEAALQWAREAGYPLVLKLFAGAGSSNVCLVSSFAQACFWLERLFGRGLGSLQARALGPGSRLKGAVRMLLRGEADCPWELHKNYAMFQEFLPGNDFDTRVTVIGNRAFAFRRFNRPGDFRASGSGRIDHDPQAIQPEMLRLAFDVAGKLATQSCALDCLWRRGEPVVVEVSYTYASWAVHDCPGHWDADLHWRSGTMRPEEAQVEDFLAALAARGRG